jgi:hypothetical protein
MFVQAKNQRKAGMAMWGNLSLCIIVGEILKIMRSVRTMTFMKCQGKNFKSLVDNATIIDDDEESSEEGRKSLTPNSVAKIKRLDEKKYAKGKGNKTGDDDIKKSLEANINVRKEMTKDIRW